MNIFGFLFKKEERASDGFDVQQFYNLDEQRKVIEEAISKAKKRVIIFSPFLNDKSIEKDGLYITFKRLTELGVSVIINTDLALSTSQDGKLFYIEPILKLQNAGCKMVYYHDAIHNKSIIIDDEVIFEGSFNYLSARRDDSARFEILYKISGNVEELRKNIIGQAVKRQNVKEYYLNGEYLLFNGKTINRQKPK
nr:phospholipase D-like domain-containing protein [uncultured Pseudogulbenkiania sp.]